MEIEKAGVLFNPRSDLAEENFMQASGVRWWEIARVWALSPIHTVRFEMRRIAGRFRGREARRAVPRARPEPKVDLFDFLPSEPERLKASRREAELCARYELAALRSVSTRREYREAIDLIDLLDALPRRVLEQALGGSLGRGEVAPSRGLRALDVGSRNWSYVGALERAWSQLANATACAKLELLLGVEIDGYGQYADGSCRADHARSYARQAESRLASGEGGSGRIRYEVADVRRWGLGKGPGASGAPALGSIDVVTVLFPFVLRYPLLAWGLPLYEFDPAGVVARTLAWLREDSGLWISMHQTEAERDAMLDLLAESDRRVEVLVSRACPAWLVEHSQSLVGRQIVVATVHEREPSAGRSASD